MTYDFRAPQGGNFSSLFLNDNDNDVSKFFDLDHEVCALSCGEETTFSVISPTHHEEKKDFAFGLPSVEVQCSTPLNDDRSSERNSSNVQTYKEGSSNGDSPYEERKQYYQNTPVGAYQTPTARTPNQMKCTNDTTPCGTLNKTRSVDRSTRLRSSSCPEESKVEPGREEPDLEREAALSEALKMLSVSGCETSTPCRRVSLFDKRGSLSKMGTHDSLSSKPQVLAPRHTNVHVLQGKCAKVSQEEFAQNENKQLKRKHSPPPRNARNYSMPPEKYISMAEYIVKLQKQTPLRFRTRPWADGVTKKDFPVNPPKAKVTIPVTPALKAKLRCRPINAISQEEKEKQELEELKKYQFKANPLKENILHPPKLGFRVERRPVTKVEPFKLTEFKPKQVKKDDGVKVFKARPAPKSIYATAVKVAEPKDPAPESTLKLDKVLESKAEIGKVRAHHVESHGPKSSCEGRTRNIVPQPFSFEARDLEMKKKKEERLKEMEKLEKKMKEFHAKPLPCYPDPINVRSTLKATQAVQAHTASHPEHRRHRSLDGMDHCGVSLFRARPPTVLQKEPFIPKKPERGPLQPIDIKLNTELRAKEREEFDLRMKERELELEALRLQKAEEEQRRLHEEVARLRKEIVHRPLPMPNYRGFEVKKSEKVLTHPHTPAFCRRLKNPKPLINDETVTYASETMEAD